MAHIRTPAVVGDTWVGTEGGGTPRRGVAITGSPTVRIRGNPVLRANYDIGVTRTQSGAKLWRVIPGARTITVNGRALAMTATYAGGEGLSGRVTAPATARAAGGTGREQRSRYRFYEVKEEEVYVRDKPAGPVLGTIVHGTGFIVSHRKRITRKTEVAWWLWGRATSGDYVKSGWVDAAALAPKPLPQPLPALLPSRPREIDPKSFACDREPGRRNYYRSRKNKERYTNLPEDLKWEVPERLKLFGKEPIEVFLNRDKPARCGVIRRSHGRWQFHPARGASVQPMLVNGYRYLSRDSRWVMVSLIVGHRKGGLWAFIRARHCQLHYLRFDGKDGVINFP